MAEYHIVDAQTGEVMARVSARQLDALEPILEGHGFAARLMSREEVIRDDARTIIGRTLGAPNAHAA